MIPLVLVGRPGGLELALILGFLIVPAAIVAFVVWIAKAARRDRSDA